MTSALIGGRRRNGRSTRSAGRLPIVSRLSAGFFTVTGLGHAEAMFRSELILARVVEFLNP